MKAGTKTASLFIFIVLVIGLISRTAFANEVVRPVTENNLFVKTEFYRENPLGIAGNFHLVGFNSVETGAHVNGNILTGLLKYQNNFGTKGVKEISYFQRLQYIGGSNTISAEDSSVLVVGDSIEVGTTDNGNSWTLNGGKVNAPSKVNFPDNLWQDAEAEFIDIDSVKEEIITINQNLRNYGDIGTEVHLEDMNNQYINISDPAGVNYCNLQADSLRTNSSVAVKGFVTGKKGTLVINVDLKGKSSFLFSGSDIYYTDGTKAPNGEVTSWQDGNVIWNFWDSSDPEGMYRGIIENSKATAGHIIAPEATVNLKQNFNGTAIAENIIVSAETHRTDYTGEMGVARLTVSKTVTGNAGEKERDFTFKVTLSDTTVNGEYGDMMFEDGVSTFTLRHGENKTGTGIPDGISYTVMEDDYSSEGYVTSKENETGTIIKGKELKVNFTNKKDIASQPNKEDEEPKEEFAGKKEVTSHSNSVHSENIIEIPETGDRTSLTFYVLLLMISGEFIVFSMFRKKAKSL